MVVLLALVASYGRVTFGLVRPHVIVVLRMHAGHVAFWHGPVSGPACSFARFSEEKSLKSPRVRAGARKLVASFVTCAQGYTEAADKRGSGLTISFVGEQWMAGLVLFTALNTVSSFRIDAV
jgi:hypothetical protein